MTVDGIRIGAGARLGAPGNHPARTRPLTVPDAGATAEPGLPMVER